MPAKLGDIEPDFYLTGHCTACGHFKDLDTAALVERFGKDYPVPEIGKSLVCQRCEAKNSKVTVASRHTGPRD